MPIHPPPLAPRLLLLLPLALTAAPAFADTAAPGVSGGSILQGLLSLLVVIGLLLGAAYVLRRMGGAAALGHSGPIRVVAGLAIGTRERILVLEIGDSWVVVGVTATQMRTLHTMPKGTLPEGAVKAGGAPFASWLKQFSERQRHGH